MLAEFTELPGYPSFLQQFRLADMYHTAMTVNLKEKVLQSFCTVNGKLRLLAVTTAFGLDIDCPDIRRVYHWGPQSDVDSYVQESGRQGEISSKVTQSCGMGMCQSIPIQGTSFTSLSHSRSRVNSAESSFLPNTMEVFFLDNCWICLTLCASSPAHQPLSSDGAP